DSMNSGRGSYDVRSQLIGTPLGITDLPDSHIARLRGRTAAKAASSRSLSAATRAGSTPDPLTLGSVEHPGDVEDAPTAPSLQHHQRTSIGGWQSCHTSR